MVNISRSNFTNVSHKMMNISKEGETQNGLYEVNCIITIIINSISCPFTVLFNVLVIIAVKRRTTLQTNTNILLACLAVTDVLTGFLVQPSFILCKSFLLSFSVTESETLSCFFQTFSLLSLAICSCLHLMLVTCERLIAIKFTMHYPYLVTKREIKMAVTAVWIFALFGGASRSLNSDAMKKLSRFLGASTFLLCILFISFSYLILYRETLRHQKKIKTQQIQEEVQLRMAKESKALKTTMFVVGAVVLTFVPVIFILALSVLGVYNGSIFLIAFEPWFRTFAILNSLLNPLIYCWRQREMRNFVFSRFQTQAVLPAN